MEQAKQCFEACKKCYATAKANPARAMMVASVVSGILLILGGFSGLLNIFNPLQMVLSVYNLLLGVLIILTELKTWPIIKTFQKKVDVYFHLLSVPRGKGGFYVFIGVLAFFASDWSISRVCVLVVALVGVAQLLLGGSLPPTSETPPAGPVGGTTSTQGMLPSQDQPASNAFTSFAMEVVKDNPQMVSSALNFAASHPDAAKQAVAGASTIAASSTGQMSEKPEHV